ncbi:hypothetical protein GSQ41_17640 [Clostridioides difficile]|nr:hypothetical protein [Clostridioides difficile]
MVVKVVERGGGEGGEGEEKRIRKWRWYFVFQAKDGIRGVGRSRGLGNVYKRQLIVCEKKLQLFRKIK